MDTYQQQRQESIKELLKKRERAQEIYTRLVQATSRDIAGLGSHLQNILSNEQKLIEYGNEITVFPIAIHSEKESIRKKAADVFGSRLSRSYFESRAREEGLPEHIIRANMDKAIADTAKRTAKDYEKDMREEIRNYARFIDSFFYGFGQAFESLERRILDAQGKCYIAQERAQKTIEKLHAVRDETRLKTYENIAQVLGFLKTSSEVRDLFSDLKEYENELNTHKVKLPREEIKRTAQNNIKLLMRSANVDNGEDDQKKEILTYAMNEFEAWNSGDEGLGKIAEERFVGLKQRLGADAKTLLEKTIEEFAAGGMINPDDAAVIQMKINERYKLETALQTPIVTGEKYIEDERIRMVILCGDYGIPEEESSRIAAIISDEDVDRVHNGLVAQLGEIKARLMIKENPNMFLLCNEDINRYSQSFHRVYSTASRFTVDEFDPEKKPQNFCSFEALHRTNRKLEEMMSTATIVKNEKLLEFERLKEKLQKEGLDPEMTFTVLQGFCYGGQFFQGAHRLGEDKLRKNVARRTDLSNPDSERAFENTFERLKNEGVISQLNAAVSLTTHPTEIGSQILREALQYVKQYRLALPDE